MAIPSYLKELWDACPIPVDGDVGAEVRHIAFTSCMMHFDFDISVCTREEIDSIYIAVLDELGEPDKDLALEKAHDAAIERLRGLAVAGGWELALTAHS